MHHIVICGLPDCNVFLRYLINGTIFEKELLNMKWFGSLLILRINELQMSIGLRVKYLFLLDFNET
jgi:hypothetical protein